MTKFGKGPGQNSAYTKNRLLGLLNLDWNNEEKIIKFCENYRLFIVPVNSSYSAEIKRMLLPLKEAVDHYLSNDDLLPEHIQIINEQLKGITFQLDKIGPKDIKSFNYLLDPSLESYDYQVESVRSPQFGFVSRHTNTTVSLWEDFARHVVRNQKIQNCANCGKYFVQKEKSHGQRYCSIGCQDRYKKKRKYGRGK